MSKTNIRIFVITLYFWTSHHQQVFSWSTLPLKVENGTLRGLCQAQCLSWCYDLNMRCDFQCQGQPEQNGIPEHIDWFVDCREAELGSDYIECVGSCSLFSFNVAGYVPAKPDVFAYRDMASRYIILEWNPDLAVTPNTIYVISQLKTKSHRETWEQIGMVNDGVFEVGPIQDICSNPIFRVAAVNRFGSRWFSNETTVPVSTPGCPRRIFLKDLDISTDNLELDFTLQWQSPLEWAPSEIDTDHKVNVEVKCQADKGDKVMVIIDDIRRLDQTASNYSQGIDDDFVMSGRIPINAIGCTIGFEISARSLCNKTWIGPPARFELRVRCSDIPEYRGEYCRNPPVLRPGLVTQIRMTLIPYRDGILGLVSWRPPDDLGSAGQVEEYHIFYGIVDLKSPGLIQGFKGTPTHITVKGNTHAVDIFQNVTTLHSYETIGVMVRAAGPGQIIETPFGPIAYADNDIAGHFRSVISEDDTIIVVATSDQEHRNNSEHRGIGVEIFWRRPNASLPFDVLSYALQFGTVNSTNDRDTLDPATTISSFSNARR